MQSKEIVAVCSEVKIKVATIHAMKAYHLLTPWSRILEKLTDFQLFKKFPAFNETRMFITAFTSARHQPLS
jgi:hypothetical protein